MSVQRLEALTTDPELLLRAKLALKAVHEFTSHPKAGFLPHPGDVCDRVARELSGNAEFVADIDALQRERRKIAALGVFEFLKQNNYVVHILANSYDLPPQVAECCPGLYQ